MKLIVMTQIISNTTNQHRQATRQIYQLTNHNQTKNQVMKKIEPSNATFLSLSFRFQFLIRIIYQAPKTQHNIHFPLKDLAFPHRIESSLKL